MTPSRRRFGCLLLALVLAAVLAFWNLARVVDWASGGAVRVGGVSVWGGLAVTDLRVVDAVGRPLLECPRVRVPVAGPIVLERPVLYARLARQEAREPSRIHGLLRIENGRVRVIADTFEREIADVSGSVRLDEDGGGNADLTLDGGPAPAPDSDGSATPAPDSGSTPAPDDGSGATSAPDDGSDSTDPTSPTGHVVATWTASLRSLRVDADLRNAALSPWLAYLRTRGWAPPALLDARARHATLALLARGDDIAGTLDVEGGLVQARLRDRAVDASDIAGRVHFTRSSVRVERLAARAMDAPISLRGRVALGKEPRLDLYVTWTDVDLSRAWEGPLTGRGDWHGRVSGDPSNPRAQGRLAGRKVAWKGTHVANVLDADLAWDSQCLRVSRFRLDGGALEGDGVLAAGSVTARVTVRDYSFPVGTDRVRVTGTATVVGPLDDLMLTGRLSARGVTGTVTRFGDVVGFSDVLLPGGLELPAGVAQLDGISGRNPRRVYTAVRARGFSGVIPGGISTTGASFDGFLFTSEKRWLALGTGLCDSLRGSFGTFRSVAAAFVISPELLRLAGFRAVVQGYRLRGSALVDLRGGGLVGVAESHVTTQRMQGRVVADFANHRGTWTTSGLLHGPQADLSIWGYGRGPSDFDSILSIERLAPSLPGLPASLRGTATISRNGPLTTLSADLTPTAPPRQFGSSILNSHLDLQRLRLTAELDGDIARGRVLAEGRDLLLSASGVLRGDSLSARWDLMASSLPHDADLDARGSLAWNPRGASLAVDRGRLTLAGAGTVALRGNLSLPATASRLPQPTASSLPPGATFALLASTDGLDLAPFGWRGSVSGTVRLTPKQLDARLLARDLPTLPYAVGEAWRRRLTLPRATLSATLRGDAITRRIDTADITAKADGIPLAGLLSTERMRPFERALAAVTGGVPLTWGNLDLAWHQARGRGDGTVRIDAGNALSFQGSAHLNGGELRGRAKLDVPATGGRVVLFGGAPASDPRTWRERGWLQATIAALPLDLGLWRTGQPGARLVLDGSGLVEGSPRGPRMRGELTVQARDAAGTDAGAARFSGSADRAQDAIDWRTTASALSLGLLDDLYPGTRLEGRLDADATYHQRVGQHLNGELRLTGGRASRGGTSVVLEDPLTGLLTVSLPQGRTQRLHLHVGAFRALVTSPDLGGTASLESGPVSASIQSIVVPGQARRLARITLGTPTMTLTLPPSQGEPKRGEDPYVVAGRILRDLPLPEVRHALLTARVGALTLRPLDVPPVELTVESDSVTGGWSGNMAIETPLGRLGAVLDIGDATSVRSLLGLALRSAPPPPHHADEASIRTATTRPGPAVPLTSSEATVATLLERAGGSAGPWMTVFSQRSVARGISLLLLRDAAPRTQLFTQDLIGLRMRLPGGFLQALQDTRRGTHVFYELQLPFTTGRSK